MTRRALVLGGGAIALMVAVAALLILGGDDEGTTGSANAPASLPAPGAVGEVPQGLEDCLADQGLEAPARAPATGSTPDPAQTEAFRACEEYLLDELPAPGGAGLPGG